jgi:hypothetical protein
VKEDNMANERLPNERYPEGMNRPDMAGRPGTTGADMTGAGAPGTDYERAARMDSQLQPDPELRESPASTGRIAAYALGIAILLGAVFYGLNNMSLHNNQASNAPASQSAQPTSNGAAPNNSPGVTTGAATDRATPASPLPSGRNDAIK